MWINEHKIPKLDTDDGYSIETQWNGHWNGSSRWSEGDMSV